MKIGLMTYHHTTNFGSLLQTYGLYKKVIEIGVDCEIIDYHNVAVEKRESSLRLLKCRTLRDFVHYFIREPAKRKKEKSFSDFIRNNMSLSETSYNLDNIAESNNDYDKFLVGSDLVWDYSINGNDCTYMLDFVEDNKKKLAYASSAGSIWDDREKVTKLLSSFSHIGVRENAICEILTEWLKKEINFVCDPTMLIDAEEWKKMASKRQIKERYILCYFEDKDRKIYQDALEYGKKNNLPVYVIAYHKIPKGMRAIHPVSVEEFLSLILYADTVFTASYHGMLYSLYFNKNFYYYNRGWTARMESIAKYLHVENREGLRNENDKINYEEINRRIGNFRNESSNILKEYLAQ